MALTRDEILIERTKMLLAQAEWDGQRRQLRAIVEPIEREAEHYRWGLWTRLYGRHHGNRNWEQFDATEDGHRVLRTASSKEVAEIIDALRAPHRETFKAYGTAVTMVKHFTHQVEALEAALDALDKKPLSKQRKAPKDKKGKVIQADLLMKGSGQ